MHLTSKMAMSLSFMTYTTYIALFVFILLCCNYNLCKTTDLKILHFLLRFKKGKFSVSSVFKL